jgi:hypothetical protein
MFSYLMQAVGLAAPPPPTGPPKVDAHDKVVQPGWASAKTLTNPKVFFDIAIGGDVIGRIEMTLATVIEHGP